MHQVRSGRRSTSGRWAGLAGGVLAASLTGTAFAQEAATGVAADNTTIALCWGVSLVGSIAALIFAYRFFQ